MAQEGQGRVSTGKRAAAWAGAILLLALHLDFWRVDQGRLFFGWMPEELAYRLSWMFLAWLYLIWFCTAVWRGED